MRLFCFIFRFCLAPLCIARPKCRRAVSLSVRLSIAFVHCVTTAKRILKLFSFSCSPITLVSSQSTMSLYSDGDHLNGDVECRWGMKNCDFRPLPCFISKAVQDMAIVTVELACDLSNGSISNDLE